MNDFSVNFSVSQKAHINFVKTEKEMASQTKKTSIKQQ